MAPIILPLLPPHTTYVEPFGGGAAILLQKERSKGEVYNDLDDRVVNFFEVLRDHHAALMRVASLTPYARAEFEKAYQRHDNAIEDARRLLVLSFFGFSSSACTKPHRTGMRTHTGKNRHGHRAANVAELWSRWPERAQFASERLQGVVIENRPALEVIEHYDSRETTTYVDPPYPWSVRGSTKDAGYRHEMTDEEHETLVETLLRLTGNVVVSCYPCPLYEEAFKGWTRIEASAVAQGNAGGVERTEVVWVKPHTTGLFSLGGIA